MEKNVLLAKLKCETSGIFKDELIEKDYMVETCSHAGDRQLTVKENALLIDLLENEKYFNYIDRESGKKITGCNFQKIKELY